MSTAHASRISAEASPADRTSLSVPILSPSHLKSVKLPCQAAPDQPSKQRSRRSRSRSDFAAILAAVKSRNIQRLKDRAFQANRLAKTVHGRERDACYQIKNKAISALFRYDAAFVNSVEERRYPLQDIEIGVSFAGGGELHTRPSLLDADAKRVVQVQLKSCRLTTARYIDQEGSPVFGAKLAIGARGAR